MTPPRPVGKRAGKTLVRADVFKLRQEVGRLAGDVKTLGRLYEDLALLVEPLLAASAASQKPQAG